MTRLPAGSTLDFCLDVVQTYQCPSVFFAELISRGTGDRNVLWEGHQYRELLRYVDIYQASNREFQRSEILKEYSVARGNMPILNRLSVVICHAGVFLLSVRFFT